MARKYYLVSFLGDELIVGGIWKRETLWLQILMICANLDASEIHARRLDAKEIVNVQKRVNFSHSCSQMEQQTLCRSDHEVWESTLRQYYPGGSAELKGEFQGNTDGSQPAEATDDVEARNDFWSTRRLHLIAITSNLEFTSTCPKEESFPIPTDVQCP